MDLDCHYEKPPMLGHTVTPFPLFPCYSWDFPRTAALYVPRHFMRFLITTLFHTGAWGSLVVKALRYKSAVTLGIYSVAADISMCPRVDSASKNEYQDFPGGKGDRCVRVKTLPPSCAECLVFWSLNQPEPSGPHRPVIGIALPFYLNDVNDLG